MIAALALFAAAGGANDEPAVMVVEFERGAPYVGIPAGCATEENPEGDICLAELYQGKATVIRHLAGPQTKRQQSLRLQAHARNWRPGTRMLVVAEPFEEEGKSLAFAIWWHLPEDDGDYCVQADRVASWQNGPLKLAFEKARTRRFKARGYYERDTFRCIGG